MAIQQTIRKKRLRALLGTRVKSSARLERDAAAGRRAAPPRTVPAAGGPREGSPGARPRACASGVLVCVTVRLERWTRLTLRDEAMK